MAHRVGQLPFGFGGGARRGQQVPHHRQGLIQQARLRLEERPHRGRLDAAPARRANARGRTRGEGGQQVGQRVHGLGHKFF